MWNRIINGDSLETMKMLDSESFDLVLTSPPYAQQRSKQYNSISEGDYPLWTDSWMTECRRLLKPTGSVIIVIRTNLKNGCISDYVLRTRIKLHESGWVEPEELIWIKPDSPPLGSVYRPRRSWENVLWFAKSGKESYCDPQANGKPSDRVGFISKKGVGEYKSGTSIPKSGIARGRDYFEIGTSHTDKSPSNTHPAQFPCLLAEQVIAMLCPTNGTVLDPFVGSGTTCLAAKRLGRKYIGIDLSSEYCQISINRLVSDCSKVDDPSQHE